MGSASDGAARRFFEGRFRPHLVLGSGNARGLFTGYYEAELRGAWVRHGAYQYPIQAPPSGLISADLGNFDKKLKGLSVVGHIKNHRFLPYYSRAELEAGGFDVGGNVLLWVDDPVDAFFLHVQGSGRVAMDDGKILRLGYAANNGQTYVAIGREMVKRGMLEPGNVSLQSIRRWLRRHPKKGRQIMALNPRYIFFRILSGDGPIGAAGVALTPGRSLAVDRRYLPLGAPLWLETTVPGDASKPLRRLVIAQDTGAAIKGPVRGDLFWGAGRFAEDQAGVMNQQGRYYLLLPK